MGVRLLFLILTELFTAIRADGRESMLYRMNLSMEYVKQSIFCATSTAIKLWSSPQGAQKLAE